MKLISLLHFYQPYNQQEDILNRIVHESYIPLTEGLLSKKDRKAVVNITGSLLHLLTQYGHESVIENFGKLLETGQIELTSTAEYHAILPLLPKKEIERQIIQQNKIIEEYFGTLYNPKGFFPPEMAVDSSTLNIYSQFGYTWVPVPEVASLEYIGPDFLYKDKACGINLFFRNKRISSLILLSIVKSSEEFLKESTDIHSQPYWFTVMDAETFGHHRIGHENVFFDILDNSQIESILASDYLSTSDLSVKEVDIRACTWTNQEQDLFVDNKKGKPNSFILWNDPSNPIHSLQWELTNFAISLVDNYSDKKSQNWIKARNMLDYAIASDQYWWASAKPWWSLEMIELGAYSLKEVALCLELEDKVKYKVVNLYRSIMDQAFEWHRTGYIRKIHLENSKTQLGPLKERTHLEWYNQLILEFEDEMLRAAKERNYELAIKWRDAVIKLKQGTDMFDILHVVDELWMVRNIPSLKPFFEHDYEEFSSFVKDHFLGLKSKREFEDWKKNKELKYITDSQIG